MTRIRSVVSVATAMAFALPLVLHPSFTLAATPAATAPAVAATAPVVAPSASLVQSAAAGDVIALRGNDKLTAGDIRSLIERAEPATKIQLQSNPAALAAFVRDRLLRMALLADAKSKGWEQTPDVVQRIAEARDNVIVQTYMASLTQPDPGYPSDAEVTAAYEANKARLLVPKQVRLEQIALLVPPGSSKEVEEEARKKLADLRQQLIKTKADFGELARKYSQDRSSADRGGDMGWLRDDQLVPAVRDAVAGLIQGSVSEPIRSAESWHLVKLDGTRPGGIASLPEVRDQMVQALRQSKSQQLVKARLDDMIQREPIQLNEIDLQSRLAVPK